MRAKGMAWFRFGSGMHPNVTVISQVTSGAHTDAHLPDTGGMRQSGRGRRLTVGAMLVATALTVASCTASEPQDGSPISVEGGVAASVPATAESGDEPVDADDVRAPGADTAIVEGARYAYAFDVDPDTATSFSAPGWDVTIHSRDVDTLDELESAAAEHGPGCEPPPSSHQITAYEDAAYLCKNHVMTAMNASGYGMIYLTPDRMVDFSDGEAVIEVDVSTLRTSVRDWWDVWITPYDENLQLPLDLDSEVDAAGPPKRAIRIGLGTENQMAGEQYIDHLPVDFGEFPENQFPGDWGTGYETFLEPDAKRRDTFEIRISQERIKVGMPDYDFWWIDTELADMDWDRGVVQFGHHSYNPTKGCNTENTPKPPVDECSGNTWHWDNVTIDPSVPFGIDSVAQRVVSAETPSIELPVDAEDDSHVRFTGIGNSIELSFDDGEWVPAVAQATGVPTPEEHFASYWTEIPAGTRTVAFRGSDWFEHPWMVRDVSVWTPPID